MKQLEQIFLLPETFIKNTFKKINIYAIHYAGSILLHKRQIKINQSMPKE